MVNDAAAVYPAVRDELTPLAWHHVEQYANNPIERGSPPAQHRLKPMRAAGFTGGRGLGAVPAQLQGP